MSEHSYSPVPQPLADRSVKVPHLVFGLLFIGIAGIWALGVSDAISGEYLAVLGPAALSLAVHGRRARGGAWLGLVTGLSFFVPLLSWTGVYVGAFPWLALAVTESLYVALLGGALADRPPLSERVPLLLMQPVGRKLKSVVPP